MLAVIGTSMLMVVIGLGKLWFVYSDLNDVL